MTNTSQHSEPTQQVHFEIVRLDVLEERGDDGQQRHSDVGDVLGDALHLSP